MIDYFPTPYEDEWWYSTLCRYYLTTGIKSHKAVKKILFGTDTAHMGTVFPNGTVYTVVKQLPRELYDIREILLDHTTLKYFIRMYPKDEREYIIKYLSEGGSYQMSHLWKNYKRQNWEPRYCPMCVKEDKEPYYHLSHQIPMVSCCTKHGCKLKMVPLEHAERKLNTGFYTLQLIKIDTNEEVATDAEMLIAKIATEYLTLPLSYGPTQYSNLTIELINKGYWKISRTSGVCIDDGKVYDEIVKLYGPETVNQAFGDEIARGTMARIKNFITLLPDRYILLQGLIGISTEEMLGDRVEDIISNKLKEMSAHQEMQSVRSVARELNLKDWEVRALCKHYDMEPFWQEKNPGKSTVAKTGLIRIVISDEELEDIKSEAKRLGFRCAGDYILNCVRFAQKDDKIK